MGATLECISEDGFSCCESRHNELKDGLNDTLDVLTPEKLMELEKFGLTPDITADPKLTGTISYEISKLFQRFDQNGSGELDNVLSHGELETMVMELRIMGYIFNGDDMQVRTRIMKKYDYNHNGCISADEFSDWYREEVISKEENLRTLLHSSFWVHSVITRLFEVADADGSGFVNQTELKNAILEIYLALEEVPPHDEDLVEAIRAMMARDINDDGQLSFNEFRMALVELMSRIYYKHFNESMTNPHSQHNLNAQIHRMNRDRDMQLYAQEVSSVGSSQHIPAKVAAKRQEVLFKLKEEDPMFQVPHHRVSSTFHEEGLELSKGDSKASTSPTARNSQTGPRKPQRIQKPQKQKPMWN